MRRIVSGIWAAIVVLACASPPAESRGRGYDFTPVTEYVETFVGPTGENLLPGASLVVIRNGRTIYQHNFGSYAHINPKVPIASASKWLSALVLQRLVEQGRMHWDDTVADYFGTDYPDADAQKGAITLGQLFTEWGVKLTPTQIGGVKANNGQQVNLTSNGVPIAGPPQDLRLAPDQQIVLELP